MPIFPHGKLPEPESPDPAEVSPQETPGCRSPEPLSPQELAFLEPSEDDAYPDPGDFEAARDVLDDFGWLEDY